MTKTQLTTILSALAGQERRPANAAAAMRAIDREARKIGLDAPTVIEAAGGLLDGRMSAEEFRSELQADPEEAEAPAAEEPAPKAPHGRRTKVRPDHHSRRSRARRQPAEESVERSTATKGEKIAELERLLRRPSGATVAEICEVTGWLPHTARGRISDRFRGLVRTERVREVGPNRVGARGSTTRYYIGESEPVRYLEGHNAQD